MGELNDIYDIYSLIYIIGGIIVTVIDFIVCGDIYYISLVLGGNGQYFTVVNQLYNLPDLDPKLGHFLIVYGATSVTKLVIWFGIFLNPWFVLFVGPYLYVLANDIDNTLVPECNNDQNNQTSTCQVLGYQYPQLKLLNEIQLYTTIITIGIIPAFFMAVFGINVLKDLIKYMYGVVSRFHKVCCFSCYSPLLESVFKKFCDHVNKICKNFCDAVCYIFCNVSEVSRN
jgi:hypothetical protein